MQTEIDMDVLMGAIQRMAMRRALVVGYDMSKGGWVVRGDVIEKLEDIFDTLDEYPISIAGKLMVMSMQQDEGEE